MHDALTATRRAAMEPIVMISGYARSGKDSLGAFLAQRHGFVVAKTSHALKHVAWELDPIVGFDPTAAGAVRLRDLITDPFDDDQTEAAKRSPYGEEVIRLWQRLGTDCVDHTALGADLWARACGPSCSAAGPKGTVLRSPTAASRPKPTSCAASRPRDPPRPTWRRAAQRPRQRSGPRRLRLRPPPEQRRHARAVGRARRRARRAVEAARGHPPGASCRT
ncbi:MAG: hypothetical protein R2705_14820 [Ilumatobacteraceae bacterium]